MDKIKSNRKIFICGGGHQGLSMAGHLALFGERVTLWNRTPEHISDVIKTKQIECSGIVNGIAEIEAASSDISEVVSDFVMVTTPSTAHRDIAKRIAPYAHSDMTVVLNPGRTFGAVEFAETLKECGVKNLPKIAETQTIVYTCRVEKGKSYILALKKDVKIASYNPNDVEKIISEMPQCLKGHFVPAKSVMNTSLSNIGMILHCAPVLMNIGWIESPQVKFKYYYDGISSTIASFLEKLDYERVKVAKEIGIETESIISWFHNTYGVSGESLYECIQNTNAYRKIDAPASLNHRYLNEDIPFGLVPLESTAQYFGIDVPNVTTVINLANSIMNTDYRQIGRKYIPLD